MSILELQRRLVEVGRVRMGEKKTTDNGGTRPAKLTKWRLTSKDQVRLQAAAAIYGGSVQSWDDQYELYTDADALDIAIIPGQALTQFYEHWGRPAAKKPIVCLRRCDGATELLTDKPCLCVADGTPDAERLCKPTTRLLVLLRRVPGIGAWRLDTHGWYAAQELAGTAEMLEMLTASRVPVRARLRLEQRSVQRGEELRRFVVPVIDIDATLDDAMAILGGGAPATRELVVESDGTGTALPALEAGSTEERTAPGFTKVPDAPPPPAPSISEQLATAHKPPPAAPRSNAAAPIPPTGLPHRGPVDPDLQPPREDGEGADPERAPAAVEPPVGTAGDAPGSAPTVGPLVSVAQAQDIARMCRHAGVPRGAFLAAWSSTLDGPMFSSTRDVPAARMVDLKERLLDVFHGRTTLYVDPDSASVKLVDHVDDTGVATPIPAAAYWDARLQHVKGVGPVKLVRAARKIVADLGVMDARAAETAIKEIGDIPDHQQLHVRLNEWLIDGLNEPAAA